MASTKRGSLPFTIFHVIFTLPFVAAGIFTAYMGVTTGPRSQIVFGLLFGGVPAFLVYRSIRRARNSAESLATVQAPSAPLPVATFDTDYRTAGRVRMPAGKLYAGILQSGPLPKMVTVPGRTLAATLTPSETTGASILGVVFSGVWLAFSLPAFVVCLATGQVVGAVFLSLFVLVGILIFMVTVKKLVSRAKLPTVEVAEEPLYLGDTLRVHVEQPGPVHITRLQVDLVCRESATYTVGTTTRTEKNDARVYPLLDDLGGTIARGDRQSHDLEFVIPKTDPSTFFSKNNKVAWLIRVQAAIANFPDYDETYEIRVLPEPPV